jgi:hypothetical protein
MANSSKWPAYWGWSGWSRSRNQRWHTNYDADYDAERQGLRELRESLSAAAPVEKFDPEQVLLTHSEVKRIRNKFAFAKNKMLEEVRKRNAEKAKGRKAPR